MKTAFMGMDMGDCIYSMQMLKFLGYEKVILSDYGSTKFNLKNAEFLKGIFESQDFVKVFEIHSDKDPFPDFDINYGVHPENKQVVVGTNLVDYHASKFDIPLNSPFLNDPWLSIKAEEEKENSPPKRKKLCISRSMRYRGSNKSLQFYKTFLKCFNDEDITFVGIQEEYEDFKNLTEREFDFYEAPSGLDLMNKINEYDVFLGNESLPCSIATGLGKVCYIEIGIYAANYIYPFSNRIIYFK
jgi:hypothetical protein